MSWRGTQGWRRTVMAGIFALALVWPPLHIVACKLRGFSSWRFFGWGMYATPYPESNVRLSVVWLSRSPESHGELARAYRAYLDASREAEPRRECLDLWQQVSGKPLAEIRLKDPCDDPAVAEELSYVLQFASRRHLVSLVDKMAKLGGVGPERKAIVLVTRQRLDLWNRRAFTERRGFEVVEGIVHPLSENILMISETSNGRCPDLSAKR